MTESIVTSVDGRPPFGFLDQRRFSGLERLLRRRSRPADARVDQVPALAAKTEVSEIFAEAEARLEGKPSVVLDSADGSGARIHLLDGKQLPTHSEWSGSKLVLVADFHGQVTEEGSFTTGTVVGFGGGGENRYVRITYPLISGPSGIELGEQSTTSGILDNTQLRELLDQIKGKDHAVHNQPIYNSFHPGPQPVFVLTQAI